VAKEGQPTTNAVEQEAHMAIATAQEFDPRDLEAKVKDMYRAVAEHPEGEFHFEMGRELAERLGYSPAALDKIPAEAIASFAGVGHFFHLANLQPGETVADLGSGSGMDTFLAARLVGPHGSVTGIDMTDEQLAKADKLRQASGLFQARFRKAYIEEVPLASASVDCVISNGVFNLAVDKPAVFGEVSRLLRPGGRLAISDIVTDVALPDGIVCNATLWAACIGGAAQRDSYSAMIDGAGMRVERIEDNDAYRFLSDNAQGASRKYGVKSVSILAVKP
jgi:ubiquinone/menaquinone biosynthesis C-methylase UbiE